MRLGRQLFTHVGDVTDRLFANHFELAAQRLDFRTRCHHHPTGRHESGRHTPRSRRATAPPRLRVPPIRHAGVALLLQVLLVLRRTGVDPAAQAAPGPVSRSDCARSPSPSCSRSSSAPAPVPAVPVVRTAGRRPDFPDRPDGPVRRLVAHQASCRVSSSILAAFNASISSDCSFAGTARAISRSFDTLGQLAHLGTKLSFGLFRTWQHLRQCLQRRVLLPQALQILLPVAPLRSGLVLSCSVNAASRHRTAASSHFGTQLQQLPVVISSGRRLHAAYPRLAPRPAANAPAPVAVPSSADSSTAARRCCSIGVFRQPVTFLVQCLLGQRPSRPAPLQIEPAPAPMPRAPHPVAVRRPAHRPPGAPATRRLGYCSCAASDCAIETRSVVPPAVPVRLHAVHRQAPPSSSSIRVRRARQGLIRTLVARGQIRTAAGRPWSAVRRIGTGCHQRLLRLSWSRAPPPQHSVVSVSSRWRASVRSPADCASSASCDSSSVIRARSWFRNIRFFAASARNCDCVSLSAFACVRACSRIGKLLAVQPARCFPDRRSACSRNADSSPPDASSAATASILAVRHPPAPLNVGEVSARRSGNAALGSLPHRHDRAALPFGAGPARSSCRRSRTQPPRVSETAACRAAQHPVWPASFFGVVRSVADPPSSSAIRCARSSAP